MEKQSDWNNVPRDMVSEWLLPQMQQDSENFIFIQDGAPPHWHSGVRHYLDEKSSTTLDWPING